MNKTIAKKWIKALRSKKYARGESYLKQSVNGKVKHCCLGVLCEIYNDDMKSNKKKTLKTRKKKLYLNNDYWTFNNSSGLLPYVVRKWASIKDEHGRFRQGTAAAVSLVALNDNGKSFNHIAKVIEKNVEKL